MVSKFERRDCLSLTASPLRRNALIKARTALTIVGGELASGVPALNGLSCLGSDLDTDIPTEERNVPSPFLRCNRGIKILLDDSEEMYLRLPLLPLPRILSR